EALKNIRAQLDHMFKDGHSFTREDIEKLARAARKLQQENGDAPQPGERETDRVVSPDGRVRTELTGNSAGLNAVRSHAGEFKEDEQRKATESEQVHVAPEYKKSVQDYYKALNK